LPASPERSFADGGRQDRECEPTYFGDQLFQIAGLFRKAAPAYKCPPLDGSCWISVEGIGESDGLRFDAGSSVPEGRDNRRDQILPSNEYMRERRARS